SVSDLTRESFELYHAHVYLLDEARENLVLTAGAGETGRTMKARGHSIPLNREQSLVARAARSAQGVIVNDITQERDFLPNDLLPNTKAEMAVPMIVGGEVLGVLDVQSEQAGRFGTNEANVQTTLAGQIAVAVLNARSYAVQQKTAERLDRIYSMSLDLIGSANFNGYFVDLNPAWETTLGYTPDELKAAPFVSFVHADDVEKTLAESAKMAEGAPVISFENRYSCKDGSYKWISWKAVPDFANGLIHFIARDVTEQKAAEQALTESHEKLQTTLEETERSQQLLNSVINATPDWIWLKDRDYRMALANTSIAKNGFASTPEDMLGKTDYELGVPDFVVDGDPERGISGWRTDDRAVLENEKTLHNPNDFVIYTDGSEHIFDTTKMPLYGPDGSVLGVLGIARNITEQRRSAQELEKSREQLRAILDNSPAVIYLKDAQGKYITINTRYEELFHIKDETTRGKTDYDIFPKEIADSITAADRAIIESGIAQEVEELIPQDNGLHTYISTKFPLKDTEGKVYALAGIS
ncbi:MAG: PAS domain-containing protein, partial [Burkholderiales bacterium]|nr:PAS domain-containing protein [Anaerolineae bacterium]